MAEFKALNVDLTETTLEEGFTAWKKGSPLHSIGYGYTTRGKVVAGPHWSAVWVNTQGMGNYGSLYLKPVSQESRRMVREFTIGKWIEMGLTRPKAAKLYRLDTRYKHELIGRVVAAANDAGTVTAFAAFPGIGQGLHNPWYKAWEAVVDGTLEGLSWPRRAALIEMVSAIS